MEERSFIDAVVVSVCARMSKDILCMSSMHGKCGSVIRSKWGFFHLGNDAEESGAPDSHQSPLTLAPGIVTERQNTGFFNGPTMRT